MKQAKQLILSIFLALAIAPVALADTTREWSFGGGVAGDPNGEYTGLVASARWFPTTRDLNWGVHSYVMAAQYDHSDGSGTSVVLGVAPVITWKWFYAGMGVAINNTTPNLGTPGNFTSIFGGSWHITDNVAIDGSVTHISHAASLGLAKDKPNGGVTTVGLQAVFTW